MHDKIKLHVPNLGTLLIWCNGISDEETNHVRDYVRRGMLDDWTGTGTRYVVGIATEYAHNRYAHTAPDGGWDDVAETVTVNGVDYHVHDFVSVTVDGRDPVPTRHTGEPLTRKEWTDYRKSHGSPAAVKRYRAAVTRALVDFLETDQGSAFLEGGRRDQVSREVSSLQRERSELTARLEEIDAEIRRLS